MLYSHLQLDIRENERLASRWHEMSKEDDAAIEARYQAFVTNYSALGGVLLRSPHLACLVTSINVDVDNTGHNILADPAARLLTSVLKSCRSVERIALRGSVNGQSPALLRAIVDADCHPRALDFDGTFCRVLDADAVCPDCLDGVERFLSSRTSALKELSFVDRDTSYPQKVLTRAIRPPYPFTLRSLEVNPYLHRLPFLVQDLASLTATKTLKHLTVHINFTQSRNITIRPPLPPLASLASLTIIVPFLNMRAAIAPLTLLLTGLDLPSLTQLTLRGYVKLPDHASLDAIFRTTSAHGPALEKLPSSILSLDCTHFPLSPAHLDIVLDTCTSLKHLGIALPAVEADVGGWSSAKEELVRERCAARAVTLGVSRRDAREWMAASQDWRHAGQRST